MFEPALGLERLGTIREISSLSGVAESQVHRVLKGQDKVSPATRRRVLEAMRAINTLKVERARPH